MADITKLRVSGNTYNIVDESALHTLDSTVTSGGTNAVQGSGVYNAIEAALQSVADQHYQTSGDVENAISGKADTSAMTEALSSKFAGVNYDSNDKKIYFYDNPSNSGTALAYVDATDFIKDGMVDNVEIKDVTLSGETVTCLVITFNTDAGKQEIDIPISQIFDATNYYTKQETDNAISAATSGLQETLSAGTGIDITDNVISVTGGGITVDQTIISGSTNAVAGGAVYTALEGKNPMAYLDGETLVIS